MAGARYSTMARHWLQEEQPRLYWKVSLIAIAGLVILWSIIVGFQIGILVPVYVLAFGLLVPVTVALFWLEHGNPSQDSRTAAAVAFAAGAIIGLISGIILSKIDNSTLLGSGLLAIWEEVAKLLAIVYFVRVAQRRNEMDGLLLGIAAALGFSALETAAFGFIAFQQTVDTSIPGVPFRAGIANMDSILAFQLLGQLFVQAVWTAIICAAIWREDEVTLAPPKNGVILAFGIALVLHIIWNYAFAGKWLFIYPDFFNLDFLRLEALYIPVFNLIIAGIGFYVLSFFVREAVQQADPGGRTSPATPLDQALVAYFQPWRKKEQPRT